MGLRARIVLLVSALLVALWGIGGSSAYLLLLSTLRQREIRVLRADAQQFEMLYTGKSLRYVNIPPAGGVWIELYRMDGVRISQSSLPPLPQRQIRRVQARQRVLSVAERGGPELVLLQPMDIGVDHTPVVLALRSNIAYISQVGRSVVSILAVVTLVLLVAGVLGVSLVSRIGLAPLVEVAKQAKQIDAKHLKMVTYHGPEDEVGQLTLALNRTVADLGEALRAQQEFLAQTSHELRTPLTALEGYLRRAEREAVPEQRDVLRDALRVAQSMTRLVNDLLLLSRGEMVRDVAPHYVDLRSQLSALAQDFPGLTVRVGADLETLGDPERLNQVWRNLVSNAIRASGSAEQVEVEAQRVGDQLSVSVIDHGPGIPEPEKARIFEKFYKGRSAGAAGLGLPIVLQILRAHRGEIQVLDTPGGGATFRVLLAALENEEDVLISDSS